MFLSGLIGMTGAFLLMGALLFAVVAILMLAGFIKSFSAKNKYSEEIAATCVGYLRTVDSHSGGSRRHRRGYTMRTSPIFEYTYQGKDYKGIYDRMIDGINADVNMGAASIAIDPKHPEDIYHKSTGVQVKGLFVSIICFVICGIFVFAFFNGGYQSSGKGINGFNLFKFAISSDEEREGLIESFADGLNKSLGYEIPYEITDELVDKYISEFSYLNGQTWYYELATIERIDEFDNGDYNIVLEDESFPQLGKSGKHGDIGDTRIVFYTTYEYEYEGVTYTGKDVFWDLSPQEHVYVGTHGAYEG